MNAEQILFSLDTVSKLLVVARAVVDFGTPEEQANMRAIIEQHTPNCVELIGQVISTFLTDPTPTTE